MMNMKNVILLLGIIAFVGCKPQPQVPQTSQANVVHQPMPTTTTREPEIATPAINKDTIIVCKYKYKKAIRDYRVRGEVKKIDSHYSNTIVFTNVVTKKSFSITNGILSYTKYDAELDYQPHHSDKKGVVTAPYEDFFFADLDFDGEDELITDVAPYGASQRDVGLFTDIYKIIDGNAVNYTDYFQSKSDIFNHIEQYFFTVNTHTKSIMWYQDGGIFNFGWDIYDYRNGSYVYRHYVSVERDWQNENAIQVSIYPNSDDRENEQNLIKRFTTTQTEFEKNKWKY